MALLAERSSRNNNLTSKIQSEKRHLVETLQQKEKEYIQLEQKHNQSEEEWETRENELLLQINELKRSHESEIFQLTVSLREKETAQESQKHEIQLLQNNLLQQKKTIDDLRDQLRISKERCLSVEQQTAVIKQQSDEIQNALSAESAQVPLLTQEMEILQERLKKTEAEHLETTRAYLRLKEEKEQVVQEKAQVERMVKDSEQKIEGLHLFNPSLPI